MQNQKALAAYIIFEDHPTLKEKVSLFEGENIIGRVPQKASVIIKDAQISSCHAKIKITPTTITIIDMGSKNGTFLDIDIRERIEKGAQHEVIQNQTLSFGEVEFHIERVPQPNKSNTSPKNIKQPPSKKLNLLAEFDQYTEKQSKKIKINQRDHKNDSHIEQKVIDKKPKKNLQKEKQKDFKEKQKDVKEKQKDMKEKQKDVKEKKLKEQKQKKQKEQKLKRQREQAERRQKQQQQEKEKERQEREQEQRKEKEQRVKEQKQLKKKEEQKKKQTDIKKDTLKNQSKNDQKDKIRNQPKNDQKDTYQKQNTKNMSKNDQKDTSKNDKDGKDYLNPKNSKGRKSNQKNSKSKSKSKQKSVDSEATSRSPSFSRQKKKTQPKAQNRKRAPTVDNKAEVEEVKGYRLRQKLLKVTKFKISGNSITFATSPLLKLADDDDEDFDVLVMDGFIRTFKLLYAISKGIPVVKKSWLVESEYNKKVVEVDFHWLEYPGDKWVIREAVEKVREGEQILEGMQFFIATPNEKLHISYQKLERLIYNSGGSVILFSANMKAKNVYVLVERDGSDEGELKKARLVNKEKVYDVQLVLEGILMQRLDFEKHRIKV